MWKTPPRSIAVILFFFYIRRRLTQHPNCDYATHNPEAIPLRSIEANRFGSELIKLFARVGVPDEILTEQGTNFFEEIFEEDFDGREVPTYSDSNITTSTHPRTGEGLSDGQIMDITSLWETFSPILNDKPGRTSVTEHSITTGQAQLIRLPPYRVPHAYRDTAHEELKEMEPEGIIERSASEWAAPIVMVKKKDGSLRMCVDYRRLNTVSQAYAYPMPRIDDLIDRLG